MTRLEQSILETIAYFDIFSYPLTVFEVWKWLYHSPELPDSYLRQAAIGDIRQALATSKTLQAELSEHHGFYYLRGREEIVAVRQRRYLLAERKYERAKKMVRWLRCIPHIRMVGICNTLAYNNSRQGADIDLFIITAPGKTWPVRFWVTSFLKLLDMRPRPGRTRDMLCPSFFIDTDHLNLESVAISQDIYLMYWISQVMPLYDEGVYQQFVAANAWISRSIPHWQPIIPTSRRVIDRAGAAKKILRVCSDLVAVQRYQQYQLRIIPHRLRKMANQDTSVVMRPGILKFHDTDRRRWFWEQWQARKETLV